MKANETLSYYNSLKDRFDLFDEAGNSPASGQVILDKTTGSRWTPRTCADNNIDFEKFVAGQLDSRKLQQSGEITPEAVENTETVGDTVVEITKSITESEDLSVAPTETENE